MSTVFALAGISLMMTAAGRDGTVNALVKRELPALRRDLNGAKRAAAVFAGGSR